MSLAKSSLLALLFCTSMCERVLFNSNSLPESTVSDYSLSMGDTSEVVSYRTYIKQNNLKFITKHNSLSKRTYDLFPYEWLVSLTPEEIAKTYLIQVPVFYIEDVKILAKAPEESSLMTNLKEDFISYGPGKDWQAEGFTSPIKTQGKCGSCWAFSAVLSMEFASARAGIRVNLSQQQLVDCARNNNFGCSGGWPHLAFNYAIVHGMMRNQEYPYSADSHYNGKQTPCKYIASRALFKLKTWGLVPQRNCIELARRLQQTILSVAVTSNNNDFLFYKSGILTSCGSSTTVDHAVNLIGYRSQNANGRDYWLVQNTWSSRWGENGTIRISNTVNQGNLCQICYVATYATV